jgi:ATP-binding cassette, subfamily B, multidrug efflux pump
MHRDYGYFEEDKLGKPYDLGLLGRLIPFVRPYWLLFLVSILVVSAVTIMDLALPYLTKEAIDRYIVQDTGNGEPGMSTQTRLYTSDLRIPENAEVVKKYPALFRVEGNFAKISYENLATLKSSDLVVLRKEDRKGVVRITLIFVVVVFCHFILSFANTMVLEYAGQSIMHDLRIKLFSHIQELSVAFFTRNPVGRLVTRVTSDVQNMHEFFTSIITVLFKDIFLLVGIMIVLLVMDWRLALICFVMLPVIFITTGYFSRLARNIFRDLRIKVAEINTRLQESIDGIRVLQLFTQEKRNYERFRKLNHDNYLLGMRQINIFAVFMPVIEVLSSITTALVIWYGGRGVLGDGLSLGVLVAFISYMKMFFRPIRDIAEKYNIMQSAMASSERIFMLLDTDDRIPEPTAGAKKAPADVEKTSISSDCGVETKERRRNTNDLVAFHHVWFAYHGQDWILKDVSFTVRRGETLAIVGPTGAGKSTIIHLLERFYDTTKGRVAIAGVDIRRVPKAVLRNRLALITQDVFLFAESLGDNITGGNPELTDARLERIMSACHLDRVIKTLPGGLDSVLTEGGRTLSSGERQLVAFARALAREPEILILDEATSSVDTETEKLIQEATLKLMEGRTAIVVAHRLSTIRHAHKIIVVNKGRIQETGSHEQLMGLKGLYYQLHQWQAMPKQ